MSNLVENVENTGRITLCYDTNSNSLVISFKNIDEIKDYLAEELDKNEINEYILDLQEELKCREFKNIRYQKLKDNFLKKKEQMKKLLKEEEDQYKLKQQLKIEKTQQNKIKDDNFSDEEIEKKKVGRKKKILK